MADVFVQRGEQVGQSRRPARPEARGAGQPEPERQHYGDHAQHRQRPPGHGIQRFRRGRHEADAESGAGQQEYGNQPHPVPLRSAFGIAGTAEGDDQGEHTGGGADD
ncbi:hypothetical protein [Actinoplanes sp. NPDC051859]|uniref:hypothetical protein n=1 Tax=Actinoplanes sp. NPDC051859 TaxID=3363909 RepID=UPI0037A30441